MIATDHLRALLQSAERDPVLVVIEGRAEVIAAGRLAAEEYRGALEVVTREELVRRIGESPSERELDEQAALLDTAISELGA
ncbi:putative fAD-dependent pyridine nucleotide-disulfide oxidoreductase [Mycolicibacterium hassiacum DSM 44199]|jgi:hypothetical protein|uniref:Putative fAD-dependent pyridine nucleotide-disulfide oxidoreductase n=1 Tax=Mycolicibacterium hassiacum (strain DSM 44199 / CIP 105218 / JCM 12690 / 3849) TaxID=1122247 RepID=K5B7R9_MYCHD|nr:hypothetical protein [Mycolicibacterium hassiacum]EKF22428.1 putative fAD-dependent pyridine nucleotide-disulfide oxidoreductase [Mycolicibacterium hassiacum DSM 44199]MBX5487142.1 hypothetical protein [Mycolicibacterium hassiacum]MDA4084926.1 FAD-dependent pyridine nucleotide-disulfide oxidoreductase [Mycolicibacterium hassiacum DSM 44199]PZN23264.1 MAG: hypothetical protein DIU75_05800 [Mycolicibacterium hassiacum]VCT91754.1 hypothetical protein MHAS_03473 [Mycolicibacterium hassiacum DSM